MAIVTEIRNHVNDWLEGNISFRQFENWLVDAAATIAAQGDLVSESLIDEIDGLLSEYSDGVLNRDELRAGLTSAIRPFVQSGTSLELALPLVDARADVVDTVTDRHVEHRDRSIRVIRDWQLACA